VIRRHRRRRATAASIAALASLLVVGCSGDTTGPTTDGTVAPTANPSTTGTLDGPPRPVRWYGVQDGAVVVAEGDTVEPVVEPGALDEYGETPILVRLGAETLFVSFCCEPAEGEAAAIDLSDGAVFESWSGIISSVTGDDRWARVLTNGMQVLVEAPGGEPLVTTAREFVMPAHTALSPGGEAMAVVGVGAGEDVLYALPPGTPFFEDGTELARGAQNRVTPALPVIDADGRVWYLRDRRRAGERREGLIVDPASGEVVGDFTHPKNVVDQDFDASGTWLLVVFDDGTLGWRSTTGETGDLPGEGWVTADW
jgi:hypothetical protein